MEVIGFIIVLITAILVFLFLIATVISSKKIDKNGWYIGKKKENENILKKNRGFFDKLFN